MQGFAAGIMIAASFWSLLQPSIEYGKDGSLPAWLPAAIGFLFGGIFIRVLDSVIPHLHQRIGDKSQYREGVKTSLSKNTLLVLAITLHNIPEGLSIGVAFGGIATGNSQTTFLGALGLAIGRNTKHSRRCRIINALLELQAHLVGKLSITVKLQQL